MHLQLHDSSKELHGPLQIASFGSTASTAAGPQSARRKFELSLPGGNSKSVALTLHTMCRDEIGHLQSTWHSSERKQWSFATPWRSGVLWSGTLKI